MPQKHNKSFQPTPAARLNSNVRPRMRVFAALRDDAHQGWVWLQDPALKPRSVVCISNPANGMTVYCEALQIDPSFLKAYNKPPRHTISRPTESIVIGAWYRAGLGGISTQADVPLEIHACNSWVGKFCACIHHPQAVVRVGAWLGGIGLILGIIGLGLGVATFR